MSIVIETYVDRAFEVAAHHPDSLQTPELIFKALSDRLETSDDGWILYFNDGPFAEAMATDRSYQKIANYSLEFTLRQPQPLAVITNAAALWTRSIALPDSGTYQWSRIWQQPGSTIMMTCSTPRLADSRDPISSLTCFISTPVDG